MNTTNPSLATLVQQHRQLADLTICYTTLLTTIDPSLAHACLRRATDVLELATEPYEKSAQAIREEYEWYAGVQHLPEHSDWATYAARTREAFSICEFQASWAVLKELIDRAAFKELPMPARMRTFNFKLVQHQNEFPWYGARVAALHNLVVTRIIAITDYVPRELITLLSPTRNPVL